MGSVEQKSAIADDYVHTVLIRTPESPAQMLAQLIEHAYLGPMAYALWKLPAWVRQWLAVARDVRDFRQGR